MPRNAKNRGPYKKKEFELYKLWAALPSYLRGADEETLRNKGYTTPLVKKLVGIRTQGDFARKFGIKDQGTLTDWNQKIDWDEVRREYLDPLLKELKADTIHVLEGVRNLAITEGNPNAARLWLRYVEGWDPGGLPLDRTIEVNVNAVCPLCWSKEAAGDWKELKKLGWHRVPRNKGPMGAEKLFDLPPPPKSGIKAPDPDVPPEEPARPFRSNFRRRTAEERRMDSYE